MDSAVRRLGQRPPAAVSVCHCLHTKLTAADAGDTLRHYLMIAALARCGGDKCKNISKRRVHMTQ